MIHRPELRVWGASTASETANKPAITVLMPAAAMSVVTPEAEVILKRRNFRLCKGFLDAWRCWMWPVFRSPGVRESSREETAGRFKLG